MPSNKGKKKSNFKSFSGKQSFKPATQTQADEEGDDDQGLLSKSVIDGFKPDSDNGNPVNTVLLDKLKKANEKPFDYGKLGTIFVYYKRNYIGKCMC